MKPVDRYANWTDPMYHYLTWCLFAAMYAAIEWHEQEKNRITLLKEEAAKNLTVTERSIIENRALRLSNGYDKQKLETLEKMYWYELHEREENYDYGYDDFVKAPIDFNRAFYDLWTHAVRKKITVKITYDSTTSGISERLVDPYRTRSPYGEGYCHNRKEVRKFRFDRIIGIEITNKRFTNLAL